MRQPNKNRKSSFYPYLILSIILFTLFDYSVYASVHTDEAALAKTNHEMLNEVGAGTLLMRNGKQEIYQPATLLKTQAKISISGPVATTEIMQSFQNTGFDFAESIYVFPLPENSAVEYMEVQIGERRIVGKIMEKNQAKKVYVQAKRDGKRAALVEQSRPNMFTTSVANIPAGETVTVVLRLNQTLVVQSNASDTSKLYEYRLPMTITPRYRPGGITVKHVNSETDRETPNTQKLIGNESNLFPPQVKLGNNNGLNPISIQIDMHDIKFDDDVESMHHKVQQETVDKVRYLKFSDTSFAMDQDFVLRWTMNDDNESRAQFFTETIDGQEYGLLVLSPPNVNQTKKVIPREVIFIIDSSGSMGGASMRQAKKSLLFALDNLAPHERFNIIDFDSGYTQLFKAPKIANSDNQLQARNFIRKLRADGGTEMAAALNAALSMPTDSEFLKQIVFITDGAVSNEQKLFSLLHKKLNKARLFTVGIGSAPNSYFMRKAADFGRGSFTYIGSLREVQPRMSELFQKIGSPLLQDIELEFPVGIEIEQWPKNIPDLYAGEALIVPIKFNHRPSWVTVKGFNDAAWVTTLTLDTNKQHPGVSSLWARKKIEALMDEIVRGQSENDIKPQILEVALRHHLMSKYTSFVAVDETVVRKQNEKLKSQKQANLMPKGHQYPGTAAGSKFWILLTLLALILTSFLYTKPLVLRIRKPL